MTGIKADHPEFFIAIWMAGSVTSEMARDARIDLFLGENYYNIGTPLSCIDGHIKRAREMGYCGKYVFGLGASEENAGGWAIRTPSTKRSRSLNRR